MTDERAGETQEQASGQGRTQGLLLYATAVICNRGWAGGPQESTVSDMGPDGLYDLQSNSFGTNGQSLLVLTRNNELNMV